ncbi:hypothetical protein PPERSA_01289 [Pseudocohnilembus persalinus]|uniref:Uncharacterized protein n=1 Tax=Pseudocohnilembus persalinus TaxID=266149 RepID=A0A0V0QGX8_PSEPJ|nr:hypothetical protein PPERSA_01289 [Pseudocohnilembus persalinus]|eukprot:KRX01386.1 hypothetical protein PPERSA_01289 [Pseudocohnilembus persalinus]
MQTLSKLYKFQTKTYQLFLKQTFQAKNQINQIQNTCIFSFSSKQTPSDISRKKLQKKLKKKKQEKEIEAKTLNQQENEYDEENQQESNQDIDLQNAARQDTQNIPPNLVIKNLLYPQKDSQIIVLGVENHNVLHASYVYDVLEQSDPEVIMTQLHPDQPYFINSYNDFTISWNQFVKGNFDYKFLINPKPSYLGDITMNQELIDHFVAGIIFNTPNEFDTTEKQIKVYNHFFENYTTSTFFTPFMFKYNNPHYKASIVVNDFPILKHRDFVARNIEISELRNIFKNLAEEQKKSNFNFDPQLFAPEYLLKPRLSYMIETLKHASYSNKRIVAVMDRHMADLLDEEWRNLDTKLYNFNKFYTINNKTQKDLTFVEYIEKHVILDLMFQPILRKFFVLNQTFPFIANDLIGYTSMHTNIFIIFEHYYRNYVKMLFSDLGDEMKQVNNNDINEDQFTDLQSSMRVVNTGELNEDDDFLEGKTKKQQMKKQKISLSQESLFN